MAKMARLPREEPYYHDPKFVDAPDVIRYPGFHCGRYAQGPVNPAEVVVGVPEG